MRRPSTEQAVPSWYTCNSQPKAAETNLVGMPVMTLLPPSVPSLATSPTTMPRASSFWRSVCLLWPTSSPKGLTCEGWLWCDRCLSKTSHLWSRRWQSRETTSGRWTRFLPKMTWTRCWSTTTFAWGATCAPWTWYWKTSPEKVRKVRMRSSSRLSSGTRRGWNQLKRNWMTRKWRTISSRWQRQDPWGISQTAADDPNEVEASSWGASRLRPEENNQFKSGFEALAFRRQALSRGWAEVEACRIHVSFAGEKNCDAWGVLWVSHPRVIFTYCMHNCRYPTLVSMIPRYQYLSINDTQSLVSMIPRYQYPSINDTQNRVSMMPQTAKPNINDTLIPVSKYQWYPEPSINDTQNRVSMIPQTEYQWYPDTNIQVSTIPRTKYQWYPDTSIQVSTIPRTEYQWYRDTSIQVSTIRYTELSINHSPNKQQQTNRFTLNFFSQTIKHGQIVSPSTFDKNMKHGQIVSPSTFIAKPSNTDKSFHPEPLKTKILTSTNVLKPSF